MITYTTGNMLESPYQAYVNPVNTVGVMGAGLALKIKHMYPSVYAEYAKACDNWELRPGRVLVSKVSVEDKALHPWRIQQPDYVIHLATKENWSKPSRLTWVEQGLQGLANTINRLSLASVAVPALGCGLGGLKWADVKPLIDVGLSDLDCDIQVYAPQG